MINLVTLTIQMAFIAFLAWGGVLSLVCLARDGWNFRGAH